MEPAKADSATTSSNMDLETKSSEDAATIIVHESPAIDIEHMPVADDPRKWSNFRKNFVLFQISFGTMIAGLAATIQTPAVGQMEAELPATAAQISLSLSLFVLLQGGVPLFWSAISEVKGRRFVYIVSMAIYIVGSTVVATSKNIQILIGFRCLQAAGSSAVMSIGAATLADIYDPVERGTKMGIYYIAPLLGPSIGSILGGGLTTAFTWRGPFWFLTIMGGVVFMSFLLFFRETFRHERSLTYQNVLKARLRESKAKDSFAEEKAGRVPPAHDENDLEKHESPIVAPTVVPDIKLGLTDVNPLKPMAVVLSRKYNFFMLSASGLYYAFAFVLVYTTSRSLDTHYHLNPLKIGFVLVAYGVGTIFGSVLGGRWSDYQLSAIKSKGGSVTPEMRLKSTVHGLVIFPLCVVGYAWVIQERVNVAGVCAMLFACGFTSIFVYTSILAYMVDSNVGRSSTAFALNSFFKGTLAFIFEEVAVPMQDGLGDGWMYTIIAFIMGISGLCTAVVMFKGEQWRKEAEEKQLASAD
ncbi:vacuolar DHA amino acid exporter [Rhodocollybia butyracea]|uniref:Vacuolar DHA amino acid exporter n=1 Tax=Rhodocollybia butyracea TaxID=206335 RepID=A0A9P5PAV9_9AGAR|nr:vacuolar DHA amino acid exporter [Rhodocollybia butyracea]